MIDRIRKYLSRDGLGQTLVKAVTASAGLRLAGMGFGFLVGVQLARGLGLEGYGIYGLAMSVIAILTVPTEFGMPQLLTREVAAAQVAGNWGLLHGILRWTTQSSIFLAAIVGSSLLAWLLWGQNLASPFGSTLVAGIVMIPLVALLSLRSAALRGAQKIVAGQVSEIMLRPGLHSVLLFAVPMVLAPLTPGLAMWLGVVATAVALLVATKLIQSALPAQVYTTPAEIRSREWWSSSVPMAMTEGMRLLQGHLLIFFLSYMSTMADVGIFRMASSTVALVAMPLSLFNIVSMPLVARLYASDQRAQLQRMLTWVSGGMTLGVILLSLPFLFAGEWLIAMVFGDEYIAGSNVLIVLCVSTIANAVFGINAALLNMTGNQNRVTRASGFALVTLLLASPLLILNFGVMGAAFSNLISVVMWNTLMWLDSRLLLGLDSACWHGLCSISTNK